MRLRFCQLQIKTHSNMMRFKSNFCKTRFDSKKGVLTITLAISIRSEIVSYQELFLITHPTKKLFLFRIVFFLKLWSHSKKMI